MTKVNYNSNILQEDTMFRAYFTGVFLADGCLHRCIPNKSEKEYYSVILETSEEDWISRICSKIGSTYVSRKRIIKSKEYTEYTASWSSNISKTIKDSMTNYKDFREYYYSLDLKHKHEFIKGFMDGDGSVCKYNSNSVRILFYVVDSSVEEILDDYLKLVNVKYSKHYDKRGHKVIQYSLGVKAAKVLFESFYGEVYHSRKYEGLNRVFTRNGFPQQ